MNKAFKSRHWGHMQRASTLIGSDIGIISRLSRLPRMSNDPLNINYGIWPSDTTRLGAGKYEGRSSGCSWSAESAFMGTLGEVVERYCPAFYDKQEMLRDSYNNLSVSAVSPEQYALLHPIQYENKRYSIVPFEAQTELYWDRCYDLTTGRDSWAPSSCIYLPWLEDKRWITVNTSTGLSAHTERYEALLGGLYEVIERDSFSITWWQKIPSPKIFIDQEIRDYLDARFPKHYDFHFFDITYDLKIPTIFGFCFGEAEYGKFVAVGSATRGTYADALRKVIAEIGQSVGYFRYALHEKKNWDAPQDFNKILDFEEHSIFYIKAPEHQKAFDIWRQITPSRFIDFKETEKRSSIELIRSIVGILKAKGYNVLVKDLTTIDVREAGFHCLKVFVPQLIPMGGVYPLYFLGGERLYSVPLLMGYTSHTYEKLNKYPHPFP